MSRIKLANVSITCGKRTVNRMGLLYLWIYTTSDKAFGTTIECIHHFRVLDVHNEASKLVIITSINLYINILQKQCFHAWRKHKSLFVFYAKSRNGKKSKMKENLFQKFLLVSSKSKKTKLWCSFNGPETLISVEPTQAVQTEERQPGKNSESFKHGGKRSTSFVLFWKIFSAMPNKRFQLDFWILKSVEKGPLCHNVFLTRPYGTLLPVVAAKSISLRPTKLTPSSPPFPSILSPSLSHYTTTFLGTFHATASRSIILLRLSHCILL